ncbi:hypothetical protein D3C85_558680 [compost metagenome]
MKEIKQIYHNHFGTAFYWRKENIVATDRVQFIFRETGLYFNMQEITEFKNCIEDSYSQNSLCEDCELKNQCHKFLLRTPCSQIDLAVSMEELYAIKDLIEGTLFQINLDAYLHGEGMN